jgi:glycosyltransferase involved in cell wall biosynthesis
LNISFENKSDFIKGEHLKISLVITLYNQAKYLKLFYTSIQIQELKDIEIIFVDDASNDNTSSIINKLMEKDKRIIYLKNNINKKTFYSINRDILETKGEYI